MLRGKLRTEDLTARSLGELLGKTTGALYHHFGSLDGFLHQVAQAGFEKLGTEQAAVLAGNGSFGDLAEAFVRFGLEHRELYRLMFERQYDWQALRQSGKLAADMPGLGLWRNLVRALEARGSSCAEIDARLLYAGLHGLVTLANTGRANVARVEISDRQMALDLARQLAERIIPTSEREKS
jgi:AcrR family transcriptional regulator